MAKNETDRKPLFGNSRSHALNITKKRQSINKQKVTINGKTIITSMREAKKMKKGA